VGLRKEEEKIGTLYFKVCEIYVENNEILFHMQLEIQNLKT